MILEKLEKIIDVKEKEILLVDIAFVEEKYKFEFPNDVKKFYLKYNGGKIKKNSINIDENEYSLHVFYSILYGENTIEKCLELYDFNTDEYMYPKFLIPFAYDKGGNDYLFSLRKKELGAVYYIDHEFYESEENAILISKKFNSFLKLLIVD